MSSGTRLSGEEEDGFVFAYSLPLDRWHEIHAYMLAGACHSAAIVGGRPLMLSSMSIDRATDRMTVNVCLRQNRNIDRLYSEGVLREGDFDSIFIGAFSPWPRQLNP